MATPRLNVPTEPGTEIYFDAQRLAIGFRPRRTARPSATAARVLRVVIEVYGRPVEDRFFAPGSSITFGPGRRSVFVMPTRELPDLHPLITYHGDGKITLLLNRHFGGVFQSGEELLPIEKAPSRPSADFTSYDLPKGSRGCLEHGTLLIYFEEIPAPERAVPISFWKHLSDPYFIRWLFFSLGLHGLLLLGIFLLPAAPAELTLTTLGEKYKKILVEPKQIQPYVPIQRLTSAAGLSRGKVGMEGEGARAAGKEGRRGKGVQGHTMTQKQLAKTGVLDFFTKAGKRGVFDELLGGGAAIPQSAESAFNRNARYGLAGERELRSGKGLQGSGTGGGGLSTSIGSGLGTKGRGGGATGPGLADFGTGKSNVAVSASIDDEEVYIMGNIPKEVIAKIIADHMGQIRYCYERELTKNPSLRGKIATEFVIGLAGAVTSARVKQTTMNNAAVESCVLGVIRRLPFPKPGGGIVEVSYPFLFRVAG